MNITPKPWLLALILLAALPACSDDKSNKGADDEGSGSDPALAQQGNGANPKSPAQDTRSELEPAKPVEEEPPDEGIGPEPRAEKASFLGKTRTVDDVKVTPLKLEADLYWECLRWSPDGKHFYLLSRKGVLHKIAYPSLEQEHILEIGTSTSDMQQSQLGLLVGTKEPGQIWLIDYRNLAVRKKLEVPHPDEFEFTSSPTSTKVYVSDEEEDRMVIIDLETGTTLKTFYARDINDKYKDQIKAHPDTSSLSEMSMPALAPDGQHLLCESSRCLHRLKWSGDDLIYEEAGPRLGSSSSNRIFISPDSRYVAMSGVNRRPEGHPGTAPYPIFIYRTSDLSYPAITIDRKDHPSCVGFDPAGERLYLANREYQLMVYSPEGAVEKSYVLTGKDSVVTQFLAHPAGESVLVKTVLHLVMVQFKGDEEGAASSSTSSADTFRQRLVENSWNVRGSNGDGYPVKFGENGVVTRRPENKRWWKWRLVGDNTLRCDWFTSGWIKFDTADKSATEFAGKSKGGGRYFLSIQDQLGN